MSASKSSANLGLNSSVAPPDSIDSISRIFLHRAQGESTMISAASLMKPRHPCLSGMFPCIIKYLAVNKYSRQIPWVPSVCWAPAKLLSLCMCIPTRWCKGLGSSDISLSPCGPLRAPTPQNVHSSLQPKGSAGRHPSGSLSPTGCHLGKAPASLQCCPEEQGFDEHAERPDGPHPTGLHYRPLLCSAQVVNNLCPLDVPWCAFFL